jgi:integrase
MSITKRTGTDGKSRYLVRIESPDPLTGKRRRVTVGTYGTKREAEKAEAQAITERERGTLLQPDTTTVGELLDRYMETEVPRTVRPENRAAYEIVIRRHLKPALGTIKVRRLTVEHVESLYAELQAAGYSSSLIKKVHMRLGAALRLAKRWNIVHDVVTDAAKSPKLAYKQAEIWTPDETSAFLDAAADDDMYAYWLTMVETGARTSELLGVTWTDVDFQRGTLRLGAQVVRLLRGTPLVKQGSKTEAGARTIRLTAGTLSELKRYRAAWLEKKLASGEPEWNPHDLVFCALSGRPLNHRNVRRRFDRIVREAGVKPISPHSIRKTHITITIANGANIKAVAARVGHRDISTTLGVYTALTASMDDELMSIVEAVVPHRREQDAG